MMRFVFTYKDISAWLHNFFDLDIKVWAFNNQGGEFVINLPETGLCKLLPEGLRHYRQYYEIDGYDATGVTIYFFGINGHDEMMNSLIVRFFNSCMDTEVLEQLPRGQVKIHLEKIHLTRDIQLQSVSLSPEGLAIEFADNPRLFEQLRMVQMFLSAGYKQVRIIPEDMGYTGYWFSDDTLDYTLVMADHPADIRMWSSFHVMEWLGLEGKLPKDYFQPSHPQEKIYYEYGNVTVVIPVTIAEPEINAQTIERNCNRLQFEISNAITGLLYYYPLEKNL